VPVSDEEWHWLQRRFAAFDYHPDLRQLFDNSLSESQYEAADKTRFRREIFDAIRRLASPREAYPNPYFELTWFRAVRLNPSLTENLAHNRAILYDAFYRRAESETTRDARIAEWDRVSGGIMPGGEAMETVTDGEELGVRATE
jgi:hypothetical protein